MEPMIPEPTPTEHPAIEAKPVKKQGPAAARRRRRRQRGFTLVEMLVVITIIGLIMALVGPRVLNYLSESRVKAAKIQIQSFGSALDLFYLDAGRYPTGSEGLDALVHPPGGMTGWNGPYLKGGNVPNDPWGNPYVYGVPGTNGAAYEVRSIGHGKDPATGAVADIISAGN